MRTEKKSISDEYLKRLNGSPFFFVVDYTGLKVAPFTELRKRLHAGGAEVHVVKNSLFRLAAKEAGITDLGQPLAGQLAVVTGLKDVSVAAKTLKNFRAEFERPVVRFGFLNNQPLSATDIVSLADLPSLDLLRGKLLGLLMAPAQKLAALINTPGSQLARVIQAHAEKGA